MEARLQSGSPAPPGSNPVLPTATTSPPKRSTSGSAELLEQASLQLFRGALNWCRRPLKRKPFAKPYCMRDPGPRGQPFSTFPRLETPPMRDRPGYETSRLPLISWTGAISMSRIRWVKRRVGFDTLHVEVQMLHASVNTGLLDLADAAAGGTPSWRGMRRARDDGHRFDASPLREASLRAGPVCLSPEPHTAFHRTRVSGHVEQGYGQG